jgi:hypothetical protein
MKVLILVLSSLGDEFMRFNKTQLETWDSVKHENIDVYYYYGTGETKKVDNIIEVSVPDYYQNIALKTLKCFEFIKDMDFDFVFRTNACSYIDKKSFYEYVSSKPKTNCFSGIQGVSNGRPFVSGAGMLISKDVINLIIENKNKWDIGTYDDVGLSNLVEDLGIPFGYGERFDIENQENIPTHFYHYRCHTSDRFKDNENLLKVHQLKTS